MDSTAARISLIVELGGTWRHGVPTGQHAACSKGPDSGAVSTASFVRFTSLSRLKNKARPQAWYWGMRDVRWRGSEAGVAPVRAPRLARDGLLRQEASGGDHREAAVRELLLLHQAELGRVLRLERERVEAEVTRVVARLERRLGLADVLGVRVVELREAEVNAVRLSRADAGRHHSPQPDGERRDLVDRGTAIAREERVELLLHDEAERRKHRHAAVRQLGLAEAEDFELRLALEEAGRVKLAEDVRATGQAVGEGRLGSLLRRRVERQLERGGGLDRGESEHVV